MMCHYYRSSMIRQSNHYNVTNATGGGLCKAHLLCSWSYQKTWEYILGLFRQGWMLQHNFNSATSRKLLLLSTSSIQPQCSLLWHKLSQQHVSESTHVLRTLWMWTMRESQKCENLKEGEYELMMALMHIVPRCRPRSKICFLPGLDFCRKQCMAVHLLDSNRLNVARDSILCLPIPISHSPPSLASWPQFCLFY